VRLVGCIWPNQAHGVQQSMVWLHVLVPELGPSHAFCPMLLASPDTLESFVSPEPGSRCASQRAGPSMPGEKKVRPRTRCS
jgi:hypothetical protein